MAGEERVINYLKHHSPALIFSASPTPASVASANAALDILIEQPELVKQLNDNADYVRQGLIRMGYNVFPSRTAIVSILIDSDTKGFELWKGLFEAGVFVNVFVPPAAPAGVAMMRNSFMASHRKEHLDVILDKYHEIGKRLEII